MTLQELIKYAADDLKDKLQEGAIDGVSELSADALLVAYRKFCLHYAKRYLDRNCADHELLMRFRAKFYQMMRLSCIAIDETDTCIVGRYVDRQGHVEEVYMDVPRIRREIQRVRKSTKQINKKENNK